MRTPALLLAASLCLGAEYDKSLALQLQYSPLLHAKEQKIMASKALIGAEAVYKNPVISIGANDLLLNKDFLSRDKEAMQTQFIGITQEFESFGKLELKEAILRTDTLILEYELEDLRIELYRQSALIGANIAFIQESIKFLEQKRANVERAQEFFAQSLALKENFAKEMELQKALFSIDDKLLSLQDALSQERNRCSAIAPDLACENIAIEPSYEAKESITETPKYKIFALKSKLLTLKSDLEERKKFSNITATLSYNQRQKFEDYLFVSASFALPLYGSEEARAEAFNLQERENTDLERQYLQNASASYESGMKRIAILKERMEKLTALEQKYAQFTRYEEQSIAKAVTLAKSLENQNLLIDLHLQKLQYAFELTKTKLELFSLTQASLL